jgi:hypothetical protein
VSPKRRGSETRSEASRTLSELVDIHEAYRRLMEALGLSTPDYLEQAATAIRESKPVRGLVVGIHYTEETSQDLARFVWEAMQAMGPPDTGEWVAERVATLSLLRAWSTHATSLDPLPEEKAAAVVSLTIDYFLDWQKKAQSLSAPEGGTSQAAVQLAYMEASVAMETNLARSPIFSGGKAKGPTQLSLLSVGSLYGRPFNVLEPKGPLTVQDAALLAHLIKRYAEDDFPSDRRVRMSLSEAARASGYRGEGGKQRELVRRAFMRMRSTTYQNVVRLPDGTVKSLTWGLIDWAATYEPTQEAGRALVTLSEPLVALIQAGSLVYLEDAVLEELVKRDEYGARLWIFLESESYPSPRAYPYYLFSAPEGEPERERNTPAIADLLRIDWEERRSIAFRVRKAAQAISEVDPRYSLSVEKAARRAGRGMWTLQVRKRRASTDTLEAGGTPSNDTGYSEERYRVPPVTLPGTPSNADTLLPPAKSKFSEVTPSVIPSALPSDIPSEGFDFLQKHLGGSFGVAVEELRNPESDWSKTLSRASSRFRDWVPLYFSETDPEEAEETVRYLLRCMVLGLEEQAPKDPLRYLSSTIKAAKSPTTLLVTDEEIRFLKARQKAKREAEAEQAFKRLEDWQREHT